VNPTPRGLVSRTGIIPIAHSQDTAGPMTRTVEDAAILLGVLSAADPRDPSTIACAAIERMKELGAVIVDPANIPHAGTYDASELDVRRRRRGR
jgi:Asp-tRNA(Asn)/Glu-tRNA(Gln) amidotransferase A subunit family amidase